MRNRILFASLMASFIAVACGPSAAEIKTARTSVYQTEFPRVWQAALDQMHEEFPGLTQKNTPMVHDDVDKAVIMSEWKKVDVDQYDTSGQSDMTKDKVAGSTITAVFAREMVKILPGGPPWHIVVDVQAAKFVPNLSELQPYKHGADDEPAWVQGRIDHTYAGIYARLKAYAKPGDATAPPPPASMPDSEAQPTTQPAAAPPTSQP
jgi:hypothetical protein